MPACQQKTADVSFRIEPKSTSSQNMTTVILSSTATSFTASVRSNTASLARSSKRPSAVSHRAVRAPVSCCSSTPGDGADQAAVPSELVGRRAALSAALISSLALELGVMPTVAASLSGPTDGPVLVVGATGNTGRRVVAQLRAKGVAVRAGSRDTKKASSLGLAAAGAELVQLDVLDKASIEAAMQGCTAVICATGFTPSLNFKKDNPAKVDHEGTDNLVAVATAPGSSVKRFVLVTSLLTNAKAAGQGNNDNYKFLNALGGVLDEKLAAELNLRASGLDYVIVRPGGLSNEAPEAVGNLIVRGEDTTFGLETDPGREISRDTVAAVCVEALFQDAAAKRVVEVVSSPSAPVLPVDKWFA